VSLAERNAQFARAVLPPVWRVGGVRLAPFTIAHALALTRLGSPFLSPGGVGGASSASPINSPSPSNSPITDIVLALYICAAGEAESGKLKAEIGAPLERASRLLASGLPWHWRLRAIALHWLCRSRPERLLIWATLFACYVDSAAADAPPTYGGGGRPLGSSLYSILLHRLRADCGFTHAAALALPLAHVLHAVSTLNELNGWKETVNEVEQAVIDEIKKESREQKAES
jgi:hypothetical protein